MNNPLSNTRVLELASVLAGPSVGQFLAELGADVLKVESAPAGGDVTRRWTLAGEDAPDGRSAYFQACNWGKRSLGLDLGRAEGRALLHDLTRRADVVVSSYRPGAAAKLGADVGTLMRLNPRLVVAELTGYGADDPRAGYDAVVQAESGFMHLNGEADGPPVKLPVALVDVLAAHQLKEAVLLGLLQRERTGRGGSYSVSLLQAAVAALSNQATNWLSAGHAPQRMGSAHPNIAPYGTRYPTADGQDVVLAVGTDAQFRALMDALGLEPDARFRTNAARVRHREDLDRVLQEAIAQRERNELIEALTERHVPCGAVRSIPQVFEQGAAADLVVSSGAMRGVRQATFGGASPLRPPPHFGANAYEALGDWLQMSSEAVDVLVRAGVLHAAG
jgi:crotonobetainyl-CoA:carnitine CoA-transferase CaiB-like acyl-CoA transferase